MDPRDQTFMTIHNLTPDANILFASDSIFDILGYQPHEVQGKSCFDYFHPKEVPFARSVHRRGVLLDKAAVLHYARIRARNGQWVSCECCFTVVHDVLVACTSIYLRGKKSERRALEAPQIRRIFSSSPRDPRYHMLEHLSPKFKMPPMEHEPRAALILNRFTRNLSIMFATNAVTSILGLQPDEIKDKAFYEIIEENCLQNAIKCLESAKANESIAYLRFNFRDPRVQRANHQDEDEDDQEREWERVSSHSGSESDSAQVSDTPGMDVDGDEPSFEGSDAEYRIEDRTMSLTSVASLSTPRSSVVELDASPSDRRRYLQQPSLELEAVVSCTSDGLVVVLRRARPPIPNPHLPLVPALNFENGLCAAPWGQRPIEPYVPPEVLYTFRPPLLPQYMPLRENVKAAGGPPIDQALRSIQEAAVFAWPLTGINGSLADYGHGEPKKGAQPPDGLPIWDPDAGPTDYQGPENRASNRPSLVEDASAKQESATSYESHTAYRAIGGSPQEYDRVRQPSPGNFTHVDQRRIWPLSVSDLGSGGCAAQEHQTPRPSTYGASQDQLQHSMTRPSYRLAAPAVSSFHVRLPVEPWAEVARSQTYNPSYATPNQGARGSGESPKDPGYLW